MSVFLPFNQQIFQSPLAGSSWAAFGLTEIPDKHWLQTVNIIQPWRTDFLRLQGAGFQCAPTVSGMAQKFDGGLLQLNKHKGQNQNRFLELMRMVKAGGRIVVSGDKSAGAQSFLKWVSAINVVEGKLSKNHGIVFWLTVKDRLGEKTIDSLAAKPRLIDGIFQSEAGMFSHGRADTGSKMLVRHMDRIVFGKTADFGAGWGYLSYEAIKEAKKLTEIDLYEADYNALKAAEKHLEKRDRTIAAHYFWRDIIGEPIEKIYDTILSNPPFHEGRATDVSLGQKFIEVAAKRLKPGGCLLMVANRQLPYETTINKLFRKAIVLEEQNGFKVFEARK